MVHIGVTPSCMEKKRVAVNQDYLEAVWRAGAVPVLLPLTTDEARLRHMLEQLDGLLLTGGEDIDPALYGAEKQPWCGPVVPERDAMELPLVRMALERDLPLLAICRGEQVLSCALGGTLYQDIGKEYGGAVRHPRQDLPRDPVHEAELAPGSLLRAIMGADRVRVNSRHHQAVRTPGSGLVVNARTDGLTEGVEAPLHRFVLGVQWHPESLCDRYPEHQALFNALVHACQPGA